MMMLPGNRQHRPEKTMASMTATRHLPEIRRHLPNSPAERAMHVGRRKELYEKLHPETRHGTIGKGRAKSRQVGDSKVRFTKDAANKTGKSERNIQRDAAVPVVAKRRKTTLKMGLVLSRQNSSPRWR
jgi:hypothetical protein